METASALPLAVGHPVTLEACLDTLELGEAIILPTAAASLRIREAFDARQLAAGRRAWQPARSLAWSQWTTSLWSELIVSGHETRLLLNKAQEASVWREIIASDSLAAAGAWLSSAESLAELCHSGWSLAARYGVTGELRASANTQDSRTFAAWASEFSRRCSARSLLSSAGLEEALTQHLRAGNLQPPATLHLVGFEELFPSQDTLLNDLRDGGCAILQSTLHFSPDSASERPRPTHLTVADASSELRFVARWLRETLLHRAATQPSAPLLNIAVLTPGSAEELRDDLEPIFREVLTPELQPISADLSSTPWSFSSGPPLSSLPLIRPLLDLARWLIGPLPLARISNLLLSPYLAQSSDPEANARFDANVLRKTKALRPDLDLAQFSLLASRFPAVKQGEASYESAAAAGGAAPWAKPVAELAATAPLNLDRSYADWTELIRRLARVAGWPGPRILTASEFEATRAWEAALDLVATLDFAGRRVPFTEALTAIERHAQTAPLARPPAGASIRVMSLAESAGQVFDAALLLHTNDTDWPSPEHPHPLLSWSLQRRLSMPGSDPAAAFARALNSAQSLRQRTPHLLFTNAAGDCDGPTRPSPLIPHLYAIPRSATDLLPPEAPATIVAEDIIPDQSEIPVLPEATVRGGARLLQLQAACGFLAFAELRLRASSLESPGIGLNPRESGNLLHTALQLFWREVRTQDTLRAMPSEARAALLDRCVRDALRRAPRPNGRWDEAYIELQADRLNRLLLVWLDEELDRAPFRVVGLEEKAEITVGPLQLQVRMDRIDRVEEDTEETAGTVFVDYKTGYAADPRSWAGLRPDEPQLPLYSLLADPDELRAVVFARIRAGKDKKWTGYADRAGLLPLKKSEVVDLATQTGEWRAVLDQLAEDFYNGRASVHPKNYAQNCTRCAQRLLCRLDPASLLSSAASDDTSPEAIEMGPDE